MHRRNNLIRNVHSREITTGYRFALNTTVSIRSYKTYHHSMLQIVAMAYVEDLIENSTSELRPTQSEISADQNTYELHNLDLARCLQYIHRAAKCVYSLIPK